MANDRSNGKFELEVNDTVLKPELHVKLLRVNIDTRLNL